MSHKMDKQEARCRAENATAAETAADYAFCKLCPRECGVNRTNGAVGVCGETSACRVSSYGLHFGEEPCFSGARGSGTIFFTGCSSHCFFCQNYQISNRGLGDPVSPQRLLEMAEELIAQGAHNLNFVTPDHFWPHIEWVCRALRARNVSVPFLFNSSGYQREDMVSRYAECVDIFMPDFKYADADLARLCMGDAGYPDIALAALRRMVELKGFLHPWDPTGSETARQGVLVRHLILPGFADNSLRVLRLLRSEFGRLLPMSVMSQFHPVPACRERGQLTRRISLEEHERIRDLVMELDFEHVFVQPYLPTGEFLPDFERDEPFEGNRRRRSP
jgi:putative pyruvate formate lyase activating enzyme